MRQILPSRLMDIQHQSWWAHTPSELMNRRPSGWQPHPPRPAMHDSALYFTLLIFPLSFFLCLVGGKLVASTHVTTRFRTWPAHRDTSLASLHETLLKKNRAESPLNLELFPNKDPHPVWNIQTYKIIRDPRILRMHPTTHNIGI